MEDINTEVKKIQMILLSEEIPLDKAKKINDSLKVIQNIVKDLEKNGTYC